MLKNGIIELTGTILKSVATSRFFGNALKVDCILLQKKPFCDAGVG
jgi:hypothetical protein